MKTRGAQGIKVAVLKFESKTNFTALNSFFFATNGDQECDRHVRRTKIRELVGKYLKMFVKILNH